MTTTILIVINVFAALAIIVLALMQQSKGDMGSAFGGGGSQSMFGSRGSANFLSRMTSIMCAVFFISSLSLAYFYANRADSAGVTGESVLELIEAQTDNEVPTLESNAVDTINEQSDSELPVLEEATDTVEDAKTDSN